MSTRAFAGRRDGTRAPLLALLVAVLALPLLEGASGPEAAAQDLNLREAARRTIEEQPQAFSEPNIQQEGRVLRFTWRPSPATNAMQATAAGTLLLAQCRVELLRRRAARRHSESLWGNAIQLGEHEIGRALQEIRSARRMPDETKKRRALIALRRFEDAVVETLWHFARREGLSLELGPETAVVAYNAFQLTARTNPAGGTVDLVLGWDYYLALLDGREPFDQATSIADGNTSPLDPGGYWFRVRRADGTLYGPERRLITDASGGGPFGMPGAPP